MSDLGTKYTDKQTEKLEKRLKKVYSRAEKEIEDKMDDFNKKFNVKDKIHRQEVKDGKISQEDYENWLKGQVFQGERWKAKKEQIAHTLAESNKTALKMVNGDKIGVFAFNSNYQAYDLEHTGGVNFGFDLYDTTTVANLLKNEPTLLPMKKLDPSKDIPWNMKNITGEITQGIVQGEGLDAIAKRLAKEVGSTNYKAMVRSARTAMTGAQNAGRNIRLKDAKSMGINVMKEWMATLDGRTRDSHRSMDGEKIKTGDKWHHYKFSNGCEYPGDPAGPPWEVYNCRCTMVADLVDYPSEYERYDNIDGKPIKNMTYAEWHKAKFGKDIKPYKPKLLPPKPPKVSPFEKAKKDLADIEKEIADKGADKKFTGIWKDQTITYADYEAKKHTIEAKKQFYEGQIKLAKKDLVDLMEDDEDAGYKLYDLLSKHSFKIDAKQDPEIAKLLKAFDFDEEDFSDVWTVYANARKRINNTQKLLDELAEFEKNGPAYYKLLQERDRLTALVKSLTPKKSAAEIFGKDAYSKARKDAALWAKSSEEADRALRKGTVDVWKTATAGQKYAAWDYTAGSGKFNRPLRGYDGSWHDFKGVGKVPLNNEGAEQEIKDLTNLIKNSTLQQDTWLQRGVETLSGLSNFVGIPEDTLTKASQEELEKLLIGKSIEDAGFMSCGSAKGTGFSGSILNIYCPEGTQAIYCEPFSKYGYGGGKNWDGVSTQSYFGGELETLLQRGSKFNVTKVEKSGYGKIYLDIEVISQDPD